MSETQPLCAQERANPAPASVIVGHHHGLLLDGLVRLLDGVPTVRLVGCARTEDELLASVAHSFPLIALFEPFSPYPHGLALVQRLRTVSANTRALLILRSLERSHLLQAVRCGASGYLSCDSRSPDVLCAIEALRRGELWVQRRVLQEMLFQTLHGEVIAACESTLDDVPAVPHSELSRRERQVAAQVVAGLCNKRIAAALCIAESTVKAHLVTIFRKLEVRNRTQLVRRFGHATSTRDGEAHSFEWSSALAGGIRSPLHR